MKIRGKSGVPFGAEGLKEYFEASVNFFVIFCEGKLRTIPKKDRIHLWEYVKREETV
jgi:hypothetical protein